MGIADRSGAPAGQEPIRRPRFAATHSRPPLRRRALQDRLLRFRSWATTAIADTPARRRAWRGTRGEQRPPPQSLIIRAGRDFGKRVIDKGGAAP